MSVPKHDTQCMRQLLTSGKLLVQTKTLITGMPSWRVTEHSEVYDDTRQVTVALSTVSLTLSTYFHFCFLNLHYKLTNDFTFSKIPEK